ncbi:MAG: L,D-transpeptidase [Anaerolineales bacterium]|nr:L,D-transpeptidase [Anaerolineales bacterium]
MIKKLFLALILVTLIYLTPLLVSPAQASAPSGAEVLCQPGIYLGIGTDCSQLGPSAFLNEMGAAGIVLPEPPFPVSKPDFGLTYVNVLYGEVRTPNAPVFASLEDALAYNTNNVLRQVEGSFTYISYTDEAVVDGQRFYMVDPGGWMTANDISRITAPRFQGLALSQTPSHTFGWVLTYLSQTSGYVEPKRTPGYAEADYIGQYLLNHELVWVYETREVNQIEWYRVGPEAWVPANVIARVIPKSTPPQGVDGGRWMEINLFEQTIAVYDNSELVFATLIASGLDPFWTRPGLFQIYQKLDTTPMRGAFEADRSDAYYLEDVPWTMYFDEARALHGAYWRANLGFPQSHGCVNLSIGDARWLYDWAQVGDWIYIWDPSGRTPEDPSLYGSGGA